MELLEKLGINWQLLAAQIVNFLILLGVLSAFLYKPFLRLLDERSEKIRKSMEQARRLDEESKKMEEFRLEQLKKIDAECGVILEKTKLQAEALRAELIEKAKGEVQLMLAKGRKEIQEERDRAVSELEGKLASLAVTLSQKVLGRVFQPSDQKNMEEELTQAIPTLIQ